MSEGELGGVVISIARLDIKKMKNTNLQSPIFTLESEKGFTLLELIAVITVLGLLLSITLPRIRFEPISFKLKKLERELTTVFRMAQFTAITENRDFYIYMDRNNKKILLVDSLVDLVEGELRLKTIYTVYLDKNIEIESDLEKPFIKVDRYGIIDNLTFIIEAENKKYEFQVKQSGYEISMNTD